MGDTVNLAFRPEGANKVYGSRLLASEPTVVGAGDAIETRKIDKIVVRGQSRPHVVFEIMGWKGSLTEAQCELRDRFSEGLAAYRARHWDDARRAFQATLHAVPGEGPSRAFLSRVDQCEIRLPDDNWDASRRREIAASIRCCWG
jgi:adenylate cyclase